MTKPDTHYHVVIEYDGTSLTTDYPSFSAALHKARTELLVERLLDSSYVRRLRRKFSRREFIPGIYAKWIGMPRHSHADPGISIEVSACTSGLHA